MIKKTIVFVLTFITMITAAACVSDTDDTPKGESPSGNTNTEITATFPEIKINCPDGAPLNKEDGYVSATVSTANCEESEVINSEAAKIKIRGNSTSKADKKPYRIKFNKKQSMLGLNDGRKFKNWVLLADAFDYSMMRNYFILNTGNLLSNVHSSDCAHVSVYINDEYQGVYLLAEQNEVNEGRVDVDEDNVETSAITGYFVEADSRALDECKLFTSSTSVDEIDVEADYCFAVKYKSKASVSSPDLTQLFAVKSDISSNKEIAREQLSKISNYMQRVYDALFSYQGENAIRELIDVNSAVDMFIVNNIASLRGGKRSDYYYIDFTDEDPKLKFGPPWDYDLDCGNYAVADLPESFQALNISDYVNYALNKNAWFVNLVKNRWKSENLYGKLTDLLKTVDPARKTAICNVYADEFTKNYQKWNVWGTKTVEYLRDDVLNFENHKDAVRYFYNWMSAHVEYANSQWGGGNA